MCMFCGDCNTNTSQKASVESEVTKLASSSSPVAGHPEITPSSPRPRYHVHIVEHDYHDHAQVCFDKEPEILGRGGVTIPFPVKLHEMLADQAIDHEGFSDMILWAPHGRCFVVHNPKKFVEEGIMKRYFKHNNFASFQRQLNLYGFRRLTRGPDKHGYYHELFLRNRPQLSYRIQRMKLKGTGVRARTNPHEEPNFYLMPAIGQSTCVAPSPDETTSSSSPSKVSPANTVTPNVKPMEAALPPLDDMLPPPAMVSEHEDDDVLLEFGKPFHYTDPDQYHGGGPETSTDMSQAELRDFLNQLSTSIDLYEDMFV